MHSSCSAAFSKLKIAKKNAILLLIKEYRDPETGMLAAFAYVKKSTLIQQLLKRITISLIKGRCRSIKSTTK